MELLRRMMRRGRGTATARWHQLLREAAGRLDGFAPRRVLLLVDAPSESAHDVAEAAFPGAEVVVLDHGDHEDLFTAAAAQAQADLVVDARLSPAAQKYWAFRRLFLGLCDGGRYVVLTLPQADPASDTTPPPAVVDPYRRPVERTPPAGSLDEWLTTLQDARRWSTARRRRGLTHLERQLVSAVGEVVRADEIRIVTKVGEHLLKLDPEGTRSALVRRGVRHREITRRPARTVSTPVRLYSNAPEFSAARFPATEDVPELVCRTYEDVVCAPRQVVSVAGLLLPESYVQPWRRPLGQLTGNTTASEYGTVPGRDGGLVELDGTYFHLDNEVPGHYGHFLTHDLTRLWAWGEALAAFPDLRLLLGGTGAENTVPGFVLEMLAAFGIGPDRVTVLAGPTRVERLVTATQAFQQPLFLAPEAAGTWSRVRDALVRSVPEVAVPSRAFVARTDQTRRACRNAAEVERRFVEAGFEIVHPELLPLGAQAKLFAQAEVVAGYAGSGMINAVWSQRPATRIVISSRSYPAINEYHLARLFGSELHYLWCDPDVPVPDSGMTKQAFHSSFAVDLERDGPVLDRLLARTGPG